MIAGLAGPLGEEARPPTRSSRAAPAGAGGLKVIGGARSLIHHLHDVRIVLRLGPTTLNPAFPASRGKHLPTAAEMVAQAKH